MISDTPNLIPVRMLSEHVYCPRLAYLEWSDQLWAANADTAAGDSAHRRVDRRSGMPPDPGSSSERPASTSVEVSSERYGLVGRIDLLEAHEHGVVPVEYKTGLPRDGPQVLWEPELVQLCAQVLILRDLGYEVPHAAVWFAGTRTRHDIEIDERLMASTLRAISDLRLNAAADTPPAPLVDSPKCPRCSLVGLCMPDEINLLSVRATDPPRRLIAAAPSAQPLYAMTQGSRITRRGGRVVLLEEGHEVASRRLLDISHIAVFGNVDIGSALLRELFDQGIPVLWLTAGGWFCGFAQGMPRSNVTVRLRQHRSALTRDPTYARQFVAGKIKNQRTLVRRHGGPDSAAAVKQLAALALKASEASTVESLLGIEGTAARIYFECYAALLHPPSKLGARPTFDGRNRRPPRDPVNAILSFVYSLLIKDCTVAALAAGLDPFIGLLHQPRFGRPSLALDLAEEMRPLIGDSVVMTVVNNGEVSESSFSTRAGAVSLTSTGRRSVISGYERRMRMELTHPAFRYKASYRRILEIQARLLAAALTRSIPEYRPLTTR